MAKLTREELRIIEQTKQQGRVAGQAREGQADGRVNASGKRQTIDNDSTPDSSPQKKAPAWAPLRSVLLFVVFFTALVFCAYLVISNTAR